MLWKLIWTTWKGSKLNRYLNSKMTDENKRSKNKIIEWIRCHCNKTFFSLQYIRFYSAMGIFFLLSVVCLNFALSVFLFCLIFFLFQYITFIIITVYYLLCLFESFSFILQIIIIIIIINENDDYLAFYVWANMITWYAIENEDQKREWKILMIHISMMMESYCRKNGIYLI